jgi:hypothetical protein
MPVPSRTLLLGVVLAAPACLRFPDSPPPQLRHTAAPAGHCAEDEEESSFGCSRLSHTSELKSSSWTHGPDCETRAGEHGFVYDVYCEATANFDITWTRGVSTADENACTDMCGSMVSDCPSWSFTEQIKTTKLGGEYAEGDLCHGSFAGKSCTDLFGTTANLFNGWDPIGSPNPPGPAGYAVCCHPPGTASTSDTVGDDLPLVKMDLKPATDVPRTPDIPPP